MSESVLTTSSPRQVGPVRWPDFVSTHRWQNAKRAEQIFQLATDVAVRSGAL